MFGLRSVCAVFVSFPTGCLKQGCSQHERLAHYIIYNIQEPGRGLSYFDTIRESMSYRTLCII